MNLTGQSKQVFKNQFKNNYSTDGIEHFLQILYFFSQKTSDFIHCSFGIKKNRSI
jgi:hypothetical protein